MRVRFLLGLAVGAVVGGAAVIALLPEPRTRLRELAARLAEIDGLGPRVEEARRLAQRALEAAQARYRLALAEARQAGEEAQRELWARLEVAKRQGRLPPG